MSKIYFNNNGTTCCFPLTSAQPTGHYIGVNVSGTPQYVKLSAGASSALNVNIGGTQYGAVSYPETTDILVTSDFICKRTATTEALCFYSNDNLILNTAGATCCPISIPDNATITICGPMDACYLSATMQDGYYAANVTRRCACIEVSYKLNDTATIAACTYYDYDWEQSIYCAYWVGIGTDQCPNYNYVCINGHNLTGTHNVSASVTTCLERGDGGCISCTKNYTATLVAAGGCYHTCCGSFYPQGSFCAHCLDYSNGIYGCTSLSLNGTVILTNQCNHVDSSGTWGTSSQNAINYGNISFDACYAAHTSGSACCCFGTYSFTRCQI